MLQNVGKCYRVGQTGCCCAFVAKLEAEFVRYHSKPSEHSVLHLSSNVFCCTYVPISLVSVTISNNYLPLALKGFRIVDVLIFDFDCSRLPRM